MTSEQEKYATIDPEIAEGIRFVQTETQRQLDEVDPGIYVVRLVFGSRLREEQMELFKKGRALENGKWVVKKPAEVVTRSMPGQSAHNTVKLGGERFSQAGDLAILVKATGKYIANEDIRWAIIPAMAHRSPVDLESGAFFPGLLDWGHLQRPDWKRLVAEGRLGV